MSDLNRVVLTGRLTADPDLKYTQSGRAMLRFDIAVNRRWVNPESGQPEEEVTFLPIVVWGSKLRTAQLICARDARWRWMDGFG